MLMIALNDQDDGDEDDDDDDDDDNENDDDDDDDEQFSPLQLTELQQLEDRAQSSPPSPPLKNQSLGRFYQN